MIILVDIDDTITNLNHIWLKWFNKINHTTYEYKDINSWGFWDYRNDEEYDSFSFLEKDDFWLETTIYHSAVKTIEALVKSGHEVYLVTASNSCYKTISTKITHTLASFNPKYINPSNIIITYHKELIKGDILIDDKPKTIQEWVNRGGLAYLPSQPWNQNMGQKFHCIVDMAQNSCDFGESSWERLCEHFVEQGWIKEDKIKN